ncbi:MAG: FG-GAP repeat protein [Ignavibacteria bacterium]|nr:FG-GAP repeat protein [Ignavibacteria bacterium]
MNNTADLSMTGEASFSNFGNTVSKAGDMNGDGYSDLITGSHNFNSQTGKSYLYMYGMNGTLISEINMNGIAILHEVGASVSSAGDVNGDGYDDVIIGAPYTAGAGFGGDAYIFFGGLNMDNIADVSLGGEAANNRFGTSVSTAGDVNGDGYSDVIVGAWTYSSQRGRAYIYYGGASMNSTADVIMTGASPSNNLGISVSSAGDLNADGYSDVFIGADGYSAYTGLAYVYYGGASMNNVADVIMIGENSNNHFGYSVSEAGDLNGDGYSDVIAGAYGNNTNKGKTYIYFGGSSMDNAADVTMEGGAIDDVFGFSVSEAGDVNGDGFSDAIIGSYGYNSVTGKAYIFYGGLYMNNIADVTMTGETTINSFGISVSSAGDVNRDGYSDVIVGASSYNTYNGRAFIFYGSPAMNNTEDIVITGEGINTQFGKSVSSAGDLNGDGTPDLIIGAPYTNNFTGKSFIYFNSSPNVHPNILAVKDVAGDQGGYVNLKFARSAFDVPLSEIGGVSYQIERSVPPNMSGYQWISVATVSGIHNTVYTAELHTPLDSTPSGNNTYFFRITAMSNSFGTIWRSNILSGYSIDNLAPLPPVNLIASLSGNSVSLNWNQNSENDLKQYIIFRNSIQIGTSSVLNFTDNSYSSDSSFIYRIAAEDVHGNISGLSNPANVNLTFSTINIKVIPQGFYNSSTEQLNMQDTVRAFLCSNVSSFIKIDSAITVIDPLSFTGSFKFFNAPAGTYYIVIKHRNTIETWSKTGGELFAAGTTMNYDFTTSSSQAFGNNVVPADESPLRYAIFSGDVNQNGAVDLNDVLSVYNAATGFSTGYVVNDVNGDNTVDLNDVLITYNNSAGFVSAVKP